MLLKDLKRSSSTVLSDGRVAWEWLSTIDLPDGSHIHVGQAGPENRLRHGLCLFVWHENSGKPNVFYENLDLLQAQALLYHYTNPKG